jgi:poly(hydroxyalkanoate) depolymerase family esterase
MNALPKVDMLEATRLIREGRLDAAMAVLRGPRPSAPSSSGPSKFEAGARAGAARLMRQSTLDMVPPSAGGAWTSPQSDELQFGVPSGVRQRQIPEKSSGLLDLARQLGSPRVLHGLVRAPIPLPDGAQFEERAYANDAGSRTYKLYVPSGYDNRAVPLVVMLHGCTQSPDDFALGTRMNELAEEQTFLVAYPAQSRSANVSKCWNWFNEGHQQRNQGEPSLIAGITREIISNFAVQSGRVFVAGLSAGGAAAAIMGSSYPDLFAAVGVHSGLACGAATNTPSAFAAMRRGGAAGRLAGRGSKNTVPTIVFHGDRDMTVNAVNGDQVIAQSKAAADLRTTVSRGEAPDGLRYTRCVHTDENGRTILEQWVLHGAGHAWSGGSSAGSYTDPRGPNASREMVRFFLQSQGT